MTGHIQTEDTGYFEAEFTLIVARGEAEYQAEANISDKTNTNTQLRASEDRPRPRIQ